MLKIKKPSKTFFFKVDDQADEMFRKALEMTDIFTRRMGCDIFSETFTVKTFLFYALVTNMFLYFIISFYNIYIFRDDLIRSTFCVVTLGMGFQGAIKLYTFIYHRSNMLQLSELIICFQKSVKNLAIKEALENSVINCFIVGYLVLAPIYIASAFIIFMYPIVFYMVFGERILHF